MSYTKQVAKGAKKALIVLKKWEEEDNARKVMRNYLNENGLYTSDKSKLQELLDERHKLALVSESEEVRLKAINSALDMAAGNEKVTNVQNNQYNFSNFLDEID